MVSEAIKRRFEKVAARVDITDRNWTLADVCSCDGRIPLHIEAALKVLMGEVPKKKRSKTQPGRRPRGKILETQGVQEVDAL